MYNVFVNAVQNYFDGGNIAKSEPLILKDLTAQLWKVYQGDELNWAVY